MKLLKQFYLEYLVSKGKLTVKEYCDRGGELVMAGFGEQSKSMVQKITSWIFRKFL